MKVRNATIPDALKKIRIVSRSEEVELVNHTIPDLALVVVEAPKMLSRILVFLPVFFGGVGHFLLPLYLHNQHQIAGFDKKIWAKLPTLLHRPFLPSIIYFIKPDRCRLEPCGNMLGVLWIDYLSDKTPLVLVVCNYSIKRRPK